MSSPRKQIVKVKRYLATLPYALDEVQAGVRLVGAAISTSACKAKRIAAVTRPGREPLLKGHVSTVNERYRFLFLDQAVFASVLSLLRSGS